MPNRTIPNAIADDDSVRVVERPDGFYWQQDGEREHGPFASLLDATMDMRAGGDDEDAQAIDLDDLREAEHLLGVPDWIDPDTGQLADDGWTRTEDDH